MPDKVMLLILDGWGIGPDPKRSAIAQARTPVYHQLLKKYPHATLLTHGENVGLPEGQMGNSEVGHINIGAGRVVYQELARINKAVREKSLHSNQMLIKAINDATERGSGIHLMGLVSDGGVHSHINHLLDLCDITEENHAAKVYIHAFTDGRDTDPRSGKAFIHQLLNHIKDQHCKLASVIGRYYAMDRDHRWERTKKAYDLLVHGIGAKTENILDKIQEYYDENITDEFLPPISLTDEADAKIKEEDLVIFFNFRTDRPRQLTDVLSQEEVSEFDMVPLDLDMITYTRYDDEFEGIDVLFEKDSLENTLGQVMADRGLKQLRIAETEKYPHVTFFFSGGREAPYINESRIMVPSPKVATYDLQPEMSAQGITDQLIEDVRKDKPDFVCLNFANADMVGHTGVFEAAIRAVEKVDNCLGTIIDTCLPLGYEFIIIADHGNSDYMINDDGSPNTAHTTFPVPVIYVTNDSESAKIKLKSGVLADIAPTILSLMDIPVPKEMTGKSLL